MSNAQIKRIAAKVSGAPGRNALNVTGSAGQTAKSPNRKSVGDVMSAMNSGKMPNGKTPGAAVPPRKTKTTFGDKGPLLQGSQKVGGINVPAPASSSSKVSKLGRGVD